MSEFERRKDQLQEGVQSTAGLVGRITVIITDAVSSIAREIGDWVTDGIEMQEAARAARRDERPPSPSIDESDVAGEDVREDDTDGCAPAPDHSAP